jgi:hypothetical protein
VLNLRKVKVKKNCKHELEPTNTEVQIKVELKKTTSSLALLVKRNSLKHNVAGKFNYSYPYIVELKR